MAGKRKIVESCVQSWPSPSSKSWLEVLARDIRHPQKFNRAKVLLMHQSIPPAPSPPRATAGHLPALSVPGVGICKFCTARGPGICQPPGHSRAFDTHAVSYQNITTQKVYDWKKRRLAHLSRTGINCRGL